MSHEAITMERYHVMNDKNTWIKVAEPVSLVRPMCQDGPQGGAAMQYIITPRREDINKRKEPLQPVNSNSNGHGHNEQGIHEHSQKADGYISHSNVNDEGQRPVQILHWPNESSQDESCLCKSTDTCLINSEETCKQDSKYRHEVGTSQANSDTIKQDVEEARTMGTTCHKHIDLEHPQSDTDLAKLDSAAVDPESYQSSHVLSCNQHVDTDISQVSDIVPPDGDCGGDGQGQMDQIKVVDDIMYESLLNRDEMKDNVSSDDINVIEAYEDMDNMTNIKDADHDEDGGVFQMDSFQEDIKSVGARDNGLRNMSELHEAVIKGSMRAMIQCFEKGYNLDTRFEMSQDCDVVCTIQDYSDQIDVNVSATPLHIAVTMDNYNMTQALLNAKCDPNARVIVLIKSPDGTIVENEDGTALHIAINLGHAGIIDLLLQQTMAGKCDLDSKTVNGTQPLHLAICNGFFDVADALIKLGCDVNSHYHIDYMGKRTPLQLASFMGHPGTIEALLRTRKINVNSTDPETGMTPLHQAIIEDHHKTAIKLLQYGAMWDKEDFAGKKPIDYASEESPVPRFLFKTFLESHNRVTFAGRVPTALTRTMVDFRKLKLVGKVKGMCFIINNNKFTDGTNREGTLTDEGMLFIYTHG